MADLRNNVYICRRITNSNTIMKCIKFISTILFILLYIPFQLPPNFSAPIHSKVAEARVVSNSVFTASPLIALTHSNSSFIPDFTLKYLSRISPMSSFLPEPIINREFSARNLHYLLATLTQLTTSSTWNIIFSRLR